MSTDEDDPRVPEYDPESAGLPDTVDDDSTAYDEFDSVREADGDPVLWPDDNPVGLDDDSSIATESANATTLDERLAREVPDLGDEDVDAEAGITATDTNPGDKTEDEAEEVDEPDDSSDDVDVYADDEAEDADLFTGELQDDEPVDAYADDDVPVGRLADPDDDGSGGRHDRTMADDVGMSGGGASAEESAMHIDDQETEEEDWDESH